MSKKDKMKNGKPSAKKTGIAHFFAASQYSLQGFKFMCSEVPFRHEVFATIALMLILLIAQAQPLHILLTLICCLVTIAFEVINSAIELIIDRTSPEISDYAKNAKDAGSFAVCIMLIASGITFGFSLYHALA